MCSKISNNETRTDEQEAEEQEYNSNFDQDMLGKHPLLICGSHAVGEPT